MPALVAALASPAFYVCALGSGNQERRRKRLLEAGCPRPTSIHAVRTGREGGFLKHAKQRIHVEAD